MERSIDAGGPGAEREREREAERGEERDTQRERKEANPKSSRERTPEGPQTRLAVRRPASLFSQLVTDEACKTRVRRFELILREYIDTGKLIIHSRTPGHLSRNIKK